MNKITIFSLLISLFFGSPTFAQTDSIYYKDIYLSKKCSISKANYVSFVTRSADGQTVHEIKQIKKDVTIQKELNTGEPIGVWHYRNDKILDFDFTLNYTDTACTGGITTIDKPFENNSLSNYVAPVLDKQFENIMDFLAKNTIYPVYARENGISGKVILHFVVTPKGEIQNIAVKNSSGDFSLDKEAMRVFKSIKLSSPPMIDGKPVSICTSMPITYKIQS